MKTLLLVSMLLLLPACTHEENSDPSGSGTRGGGDVCEIDYSHHLGSALVWLKSGAQELMTEEEIEKIKAIPSPKIPGLSVRCLQDPIVLSGVRKTAYTEQTGPDTFSTQVDPNLWFAAASQVRVGMAAHEILVMYGIEQTGDYHISDNYQEASQLKILSSLECKKTVWYNHDFTMSLVASNVDDFSKMDYEMKVTLSIGASSKGPAHVTTLVPSKNLHCEFSELDENLFTCFEEEERTGRVRIAAEMIDAGMGRELRIFWNNLNSPSHSFTDAIAAEREYSVIALHVPIQNAVVIPLGNSTLGLPLDNPGSTRCRSTSAF